MKLLAAAKDFNASLQCAFNLFLPTKKSLWSVKTEHQEEEISQVIICNSLAHYQTCSSLVTRSSYIPCYCFDASFLNNSTALCVC